MYGGRCMENLKIQQIYNRYVGPNVLHLSQMLLYTVFEGLNGCLAKMLMATYIVHLEVLVYYIRVAVPCMTLNADKSS